ncbi:MAG: histidine phosphatase family protein [Thermoanaerobaculales bacterium]|nr:histidine phosphatase family protein [Thermoanaerobaculales bacterium]
MKAENLELWLVRHGETTRSVAREIAGWSDPPLTDRGQREAEGLRPRLDGEDFDCIWSSDLQRAVHTARLAWGKARPDRRLRELNFGDLEGCSFAEVDPVYVEQATRFRDFRPPGGESCEEFRSRLEAFLNQLSPGRHLLFVHGGVIRSLAQDLGLDRFVATGSLVGIDWTAQRLLFVNEPNGG